MSCAAITLTAKTECDPLTEKIDALLPQTQCRQCSYAGCRPYAEAIAKGEADINQCPPGGETTIVALADLLARNPQPLNKQYGVTKPKMLAVIDEQLCIGCTLCMQACPVDAILGAAQQMHTVIADECTGCELCLPPCPIDCIHMAPLFDCIECDTSAVHPSPIPRIQYYRYKDASTSREHEKQKADVARQRHKFRLTRLAREKADREARHAEKKAALARQ